MKKGKALFPRGRAIKVGVASSILVVLLIVACRTAPAFDAFYPVYRAAMVYHDFDMALELIEYKQAGDNPLYAANNEISFLLDRGVLRHFSGRYVESIQDLLEAERLIQEAFTESVTAGLMTWLGNDSARDYAGEDFEDIYLSVFNALNFAQQGDLEGAMVEVRKLTMDPAGKLPQLAIRHENVRQSFASGLEGILNRVGISLLDAMPAGDVLAAHVRDYGAFSDSALARYLSVLFLMANGDEDSARIEYERLQEAFASNPRIFHHPVPASAVGMREVPAGYGRLNVLAFHGPSVTKEEIRFEGRFPFLTNSALQTPTFRLPVMMSVTHVGGNVNRVQVVVDGHGAFDLDMIEDMERVMFATFNQRFIDMYFRTFMRVLYRYIAIDIAANLAYSQTPGGALAQRAARTAAIVAGRAASNALEGADLRMSRFLPGAARVGALDLEPGIHNVTVNYYIGARRYHSESHTVEVTAGGLNLLRTVKLR